MHVIKKVLLFIAVLSFLTSLQAQNNWSVSVIDSFQTNDVGQGIYGLNSIVHDNAIHLTYYYHDQNSQTTLLYAVKNNGSFVVDTVAHISDFNSYGVSTSIQFDASGSKWIYAGFYSYPNRIIGVFKENGAGWDYTYLDETGNYKTVAAIQNNMEMGFAYLGKGESIYKQSIKYAYWNGSNWESATISGRNDTYKTCPSIIEAGGKIYLTYGEGRYPDSLITRVYVKENQAWAESFTDLMEIPYAGGSVDGLHNLVGVTNDGNPSLLHTLSNEVHPRFYKMNTGVWGQVTINYPASYVLTNGPRGSNILFDAENTMFVISEASYSAPLLSWVKADGDAGYSEIPFRYAVRLQDFVILNNEIFVYYYDGYTEYPYDRPTTLKEAKIDINTLLTDIDNENEIIPLEYSLSQNYPNPFNPATSIKYQVASTTYVTLKIYDILGNEVKTLVNDTKNAGEYIVKFNASNLASGIYFYKLQAGNFISVKKLMLMK